MQTMSDKELDELFKKKFGTYEVQPSDAAWAAITAGLSTPNKQKRPFRIMLPVAASFLIILGAGWWFMRPSSTIKLRGKDTLTVAGIQPVPPQQALVKDSVKKESFIKKIAALKIKGRQQLASYKVQSEEARMADAHVDLLPEELVPVQHAPARQADLHQSVQALALESAPSASAGRSASANSKPVIASATDETTMQGGYTEPESQRLGGIKTVGDLVNFVVSKVDHRKDKLIEFSDNDEGTLISGINLGVVKIRTKANRDKQN